MRQGEGGEDEEGEGDGRARAARAMTAATKLSNHAPDGAPPSGNAKRHSTPSRDDGVERQRSATPLSPCDRFRLCGRPIEVALIRRHTIEVSELSIFVVVVVVFGTSCVGRLVVIVIVTTS